MQFPHENPLYNVVVCNNRAYGVSALGDHIDVPIERAIIRSKMIRPDVIPNRNGRVQVWHLFGMFDYNDSLVRVEHLRFDGEV